MENVINVLDDNSYRRKLIDALYDIRTSLAIKRILKKTILASKFESMLEAVKKNYDEKVALAIDNVFEEFFPDKNKEDYSNNTNEYRDSKTGNIGSSLVMAKKGFKTDSNGQNDK